MKNLYFIFCICVISCFPSCKKTGKEVTLKNGNPVNFIFIEFLPSFIEPSIVLFDLSKNIVVIRRIGPKEFYRPKEYPVIEKITALNTLNFRMDLCDYAYLRDSLVFKDEDFVDRKIEANDGMFSSFLFVFDNGEIKDVELHVDYTNNQRELIKRIIDSAIKQSQDSISIDYFHKLKKQYF